MKIKGIACVTILSLFTSTIIFNSASVGFAGSQKVNICKVTDPTATPLNIRDKPNGRVINTLKNGKKVDIIETSFDNQNRPWVKVGGYHNGTYKVWGWVIREFISCYSN